MGIDIWAFKPSASTATPNRNSKAPQYLQRSAACLPRNASPMIAADDNHGAAFDNGANENGER